MAKASEGPIVVSEVLKSHALGQRISLKEAQAVASATVSIRTEFLNDMFQAMQDPGSLDPAAFKCMMGIAKLLSIHGVISSKEMDAFMEGIGMMQ